MKKSLPLLLNTLLVIFVIALATAALLKLHPALYDYEVKKISFENKDKTNTPGDKLDAILAQNISAFGHIRSFDQVFGKGQVKTTLNKPLKIDRCEVSQGNFLKFVQWQKFNKPENIKADNQPLDWKYESSSREHIISGKLTAPANSITYYDAYAYCKASGGRLPYQDEWVAAASGKANRLYPWGDDFTPKGWPYFDPLLNAAQRCGAHKETATPEKIQDLGHNVSEWVENREEPLKPLIIGGNAYNNPYPVFALNFLYRYAPITYRSPYVGFRCVYQKPLKQTPWATKINTANIPAGDYSTGVPEGAKIPNIMTKIPHQNIDVIERLFKQKQTNVEKSFYLMVHEVTRQQYMNFLKDPFAKLGLYADEKQPDNHSYIPSNWQQQIEKPELPVVNIDWWSAHAFATWAGGRLPSAEEWMVAASDGGKHIYPWSNEFDEKIHTPPHTNSPHAAGGHNTDATESGLLDMGGNLSEWTQSVTTSDGGYSIVIKGGNYLLPASETARIDFNNYVSPHYRSPSLGFRVAFDKGR